MEDLSREDAAETGHGQGKSDPRKRSLLPSDYVKITKIMQISDIFIVGERTIANILLPSLYMLEGIFKKLWIPEKIYEYNQVVYYNRDKQWIGRA